MEGQIYLQPPIANIIRYAREELRNTLHTALHQRIRRHGIMCKDFLPSPPRRYQLGGKGLIDVRPNVYLIFALMSNRHSGLHLIYIQAYIVSH